MGATAVRRVLPRLRAGTYNVGLRSVPLPELLFRLLAANRETSNPKEAWWEIGSGFVQSYKATGGET
jgi:hypothetical protein